MVYGPVATERRRPPRQNAEAILLHADRFQRAAAALAEWSDQARRCVEYFEGKQWRKDDLDKLRREKRPALTLNKIKPLVMLCMGYHINNRTEIRYLPGHDGSGSAEMAKLMTHVSKQIEELSEMPYVDVEVYLDGILTGRGYYDARLNFEQNDFGEIRWSVQDPFATYVDPDADHYDLNTGNFVMTSRMISLDEVEHFYGRDVGAMVAPLTDGKTYSAFPSHIYDGQEEVTPWRRFGGDDNNALYWMQAGAQFYDWVDTARKTVRLLDIQHYIRVLRWFFVDLETGDKKPIPDHWTPERVRRVLDWAQENRQPLIVQKRFDRRCRWTHMIGDVIAYDAWSPYQSFTITGFFPYFRRGMTRGMVEDLLGAQDEINKRRSARLNYINRSSNGGWIYAKGALDAQQKANLEMYGSTAGVLVEYESKGGAVPAPREIHPGQDNPGQAILEKEAEDDLKQIAGINDSALGNLDRVQSGRAIEARQRQSIVGMELTQLNYSRTKQLCGRKQLELVQNHYTEERVIRVTGPGNSFEQVVINQRTAAGVMNDVTLGKYAVSIDEAPLSKTFLEAQFEELLRLKELMVPIPDDFVIDASSLGRKEELKLALAQARALQQAMVQQGADPNAAAGQPGQGPGPGGSRVGADGGSLPPGEPGAPIGPAG